jgi:hypothetical protein
MPGLNGYQSAEPAAEHKDWPDPQCTAGGEEDDAKPANGVDDLVSYERTLPDQNDRHSRPTAATLRDHD